MCFRYYLRKEVAMHRARQTAQPEHLDSTVTSTSDQMAKSAFKLLPSIFQAVALPRQKTGIARSLLDDFAL